MQPSEALDVAAQVAVTLAGFAGVVVVFRPDSIRQWSALDRFRLQLLLTNSTLPLGYALLAILLLTLEPSPLSIWRWCSGAAFAAQLLFVAFTRRTTLRIPAEERRAVNRPLYFSLGALGAATTILQIVNVVAWNRFWPFFAAIFLHLIAAIAQFIRMVVLPHQATGPPQR